MVQENVVTNILLWDGDVNSWNPPVDATMLIQATTPTKVWSLVDKEFQLVESIGNAQIGFIYEGGFCNTNEPKPHSQEPIGELPTTEIK